MNPLLQVQSPYDLPKLKLLPLREQPAYRVAANPDMCNLAELLAAIIGGQQQIEVAEALLARFGNIRRLQQAHISEIGNIRGVGQQTAVRLKAALALAKKAILETEDERPVIHNPADAAALVQYEMSILEQEYLRVILLDTRNRVIDIVEIYHGSLNSSQVRVAELFKPAIQRMAAAIIVLHNHPSGDPTPSPDDVAVTRAIVQAGKLLDIETLDHIVIGRGRHISLKERGLGFDSRVSEAASPYPFRQPEYQVCERDRCYSDLIYAYSRAQALIDCVLVDVTEIAREAGFCFPVAITADLHARLTPTDFEQALGQDYQGRLWDVLWLAAVTASQAPPGCDRSPFQVRLDEHLPPSSELARSLLELWMVVGPDDNLDPVITIGFPQDF